MKRAYLASPLGFADSTRPYMAQLVAALSVVVDVDNPWSFGTAGNEAAALEKLTDRAIYAERRQALNHRIAAANGAAIRRCGLLVAVLDGMEVDSGTAAEIGYAFGLGKQVWALRTDFRNSGEPGAIVNLQVQYFVEASGGKIFRTAEDLVTALQAALG